MAQFRHGKLTEVVLDNFIASPYLKSASSSKSIEVADTSGFGTQDKTYIVGQNDGTFSLGGMFAGAVGEIDEKFNSVTAQEAPYAASLFYDGGIKVGRSCRSAQVRQSSYDITSPVSDVVSLSVELQSDKGLRSGVCLSTKTALSATTANASVNNVILTTRGATAYVHIPQNTRTANTTVAIQHSVDGTVWVDLMTQVVPTLIKSSYVLESAGTVNKFVRANITLAAGTGTVTVIVAFARN